jgi:hypothetical protein
MGGGEQRGMTRRMIQHHMIASIGACDVLSFEISWYV